MRQYEPQNYPFKGAARPNMHLSLHNATLSLSKRRHLMISTFFFFISIYLMVFNVLFLFGFEEVKSWSSGEEFLCF